MLAAAQRLHKWLTQRNVPVGTSALMDVTAARDETKRLVTSQMSHEVGQVPPGINDSPDDAAHSTSAAVTGPGGPEEEFLCGRAITFSRHRLTKSCIILNAHLQIVGIRGR